VKENVKTAPPKVH